MNKAGLRPLQWLLLGGATLSAGLITYAALASSRRPVAPGTFFFPFDDARLLRPGQALGGAAYVGEGVTSPAPLLVYLHGNNPEGELHRRMGAQASDLRFWVPSSVIVAAPSQTVGAKSAGLWNGFDLDAFVEAVERATGAEIDKSNVVLAGHSGAGCNPNGGTLGAFGRIKPRLVAVIDGCMDPGYGERLGSLGERIPVAVFYQRGTWARDFQGFANAFRGRGHLEEVRSFPLSTGNPHEDIVAAALQRIYSSLV